MPTQPFTVGVTCMCATWFVVPPFVVAKAAMFPDPLATSPMVVLSFVHAKLEGPLSGLLNVSAVVDAVLHIACVVPPVTVGVG